MRCCCHHILVLFWMLNSVPLICLQLPTFQLNVSVISLSQYTLLACGTGFPALIFLLNIVLSFVFVCLFLQIKFESCQTEEKFCWHFYGHGVALDSFLQNWHLTPEASYSRIVKCLPSFLFSFFLFNKNFQVYLFI